MFKFRAGALKGVVAMAALCVSASCLAHDPVILIPGMNGYTWNMDPIKNDLTSNGWPSNIVFEWTDSSRMTQDLSVAAQELSTYVNQVLAQTHSSKVVLVSWSAATIASRYYIKNLGGGSKVSQYIAIAGPQHGTDASNNGANCTTVSCYQFATGTTPFMTALNSGTEVPSHPPVAYLTIRSGGDLNATPRDTAVLSGADENYSVPTYMGYDTYPASQTYGQYVLLPNHFTIIGDSNTLAKIRSFINAHEVMGTCYTDINPNHVAAGRAYDWYWVAYAQGSNQNIGWDNADYRPKLRMTGPGYFVQDNTCP